MLTRSFLSPVLCSALLTLAACDKEESLGEVESETAAESESDSASESESSGTDTEGESDSDVNCPTDAMICPDGTAVGRSGPDCAFDPCTGSDTGDGTDGDPPPDACPGDVGYFEPAACPSDGDGTPYVIDPGCYAACDPGEPACGDQEVCMTLEVNPCICSEGDDVCCGACAAGSALCVPVSSGEACDGVAGTSFESVEQFECGLSKEGPVLCNWSIDLSFDGDYLWMYSDIGEGGEYACKDGTITLSNNPTLSATFDVATDTLTWDGIEYQPAAG